MFPARRQRFQQRFFPNGPPASQALHQRRSLRVRGTGFRRIALANLQGFARRSLCCGSLCHALPELCYTLAGEYRTVKSAYTFRVPARAQLLSGTAHLCPAGCLFTPQIR